jgi:hypothetical protein
VWRARRDVDVILGRHLDVMASQVLGIEVLIEDRHQQGASYPLIRLAETMNELMREYDSPIP